MNRTISAEYDADTNSLKLDEPLEGVRDHERISIAIADESEAVTAAMIVTQDCLARVWDNADDAEYDRV